MADYIARSRSNLFRVKNPPEFKGWAENLFLEVQEHTEGKRTYYSLEAKSGHGTWPSYEDSKGGEEDWSRFLSELATRLAEDSVAVLFDVGAESLRYLICSATAVNSKAESVTLSLDDIYERAQHLGTEIIRSLFQYSERWLVETSVRGDQMVLDWSPLTDGSAGQALLTRVAIPGDVHGLLLLNWQGPLPPSRPILPLPIHGGPLSSLGTECRYRLEMDPPFSGSLAVGGALAVIEFTVSAKDDQLLGVAETTVLLLRQQGLPIHSTMGIAPLRTPDGVSFWVVISSKITPDELRDVLSLLSEGLSRAFVTVAKSGYALAEALRESRPKKLVLQRLTARSNFFRVKDAKIFRSWAETRHLLVIENEGESNGMFALMPVRATGVWNPFSNAAAWPTAALTSTAVQSVDIVTELSRHLADGSVAVLFEARAPINGLPSGTANAINSQGQRVRVDLEEIYEAATRLGGEVVCELY